MIKWINRSINSKILLFMLCFSMIKACILYVVRADGGISIRGRCSSAAHSTDMKKESDSCVKCIYLLLSPFMFIQPTARLSKSPTVCHHLRPLDTQRNTSTKTFMASVLIWAPRVLLKSMLPFMKTHPEIHQGRVSCALVMRRSFLPSEI